MELAENIKLLDLKSESSSKAGLKTKLQGKHRRILYCRNQSFKKKWQIYKKSNNYVKITFEVSLQKLFLIIIK